MPKKLKFKPVITRVKLNPEQAVLTCACYNLNLQWLSTTQYITGNLVNACIGKDRNQVTGCMTYTDNGSAEFNDWNTGATSS